MRKFKQWLIVKLGGFVHQEVVEYRNIEPERQELVSYSVIMGGSTPSDLGHTERRIKEGLAHDLAIKLVDRGLIKFDKYEVDSPDFGLKTHYIASVWVYTKKGVCNEQRKAD